MKDPSKYQKIAISLHDDDDEPSNKEALKAALAAARSSKRSKNSASPERHVVGQPIRFVSKAKRNGTGARDKRPPREKTQDRQMQLSFEEDEEPGTGGASQSQQQQQQEGGDSAKLVSFKSRKKKKARKRMVMAPDPGDDE